MLPLNFLSMEFGIHFQSFEFRLLKKVKSGVKTKIDALRAGGHGWKFQHVSEHDCRKYVRSRVAPSPVKIDKQMITDRTMDRYKAETCRL